MPGETRIDQFESAIRTVCEPIFQKPISEISFGNLLLRLFQTARRFQMEVQPQLVLLQKTLLNIEGLGRQLDPDLDLWKTAKPFIDGWMNEQVGLKALTKGLRTHLPKTLEQAPEIPALIYKFLKQAEQQPLQQQSQLTHELETVKQQLKRQQKIYWLTIVVGVAAAATAYWFT